MLTLASAVALAEDLPPPRPWLPPSVKLISNGAVPRKALRYQLVEGTIGVLDTTSGGTWRVADQAADNHTTMPTISVPIQVTVTSPGTLNYRLLACTAATAKGEPTDVVTASLVDVAEGVAGSLKLSAQGVASEVNVYPGPKDSQHREDPKTIERRSQYAMEMVRTLLTHAFIPLPAEPVGLGARWQVERHTARGTLTYLEVATYTVTAIDGRRLGLIATIGGRHDPASNLRPEELDLDVSGTDTISIDLGLPMPVSVNEKVELTGRVGLKTSKRAIHAGTITQSASWRSSKESQ